MKLPAASCGVSWAEFRRSPTRLRSCELRRIASPSCRAEALGEGRFCPQQAAEYPGEGEWTKQRLHIPAGLFRSFEFRSLGYCFEFRASNFEFL